MLSACSTNWKSCPRLQLKYHLCHHFKSKTIMVSANDSQNIASLTGLTISPWQHVPKSSERSKARERDVIDHAWFPTSNNKIRQHVVNKPNRAKSLRVWVRIGMHKWISVAQLCGPALRKHPGDTAQPLERCGVTQQIGHLLVKLISVWATAKWKQGPGRQWTSPIGHNTPSDSARESVAVTSSQWPLWHVCRLAGWQWYRR